MGQETLIIAIIVIVLTVIGGTVACLVWHRLHLSRRRGQAIPIELRHTRERGPDGHHSRDYDPTVIVHDVIVTEYKTY